MPPGDGINLTKAKVVAPPPTYARVDFAKNGKMPKHHNASGDEQTRELGKSPT